MTLRILNTNVQMDTCLKVLSTLTGIQIVLFLKCGIHQQLKSVFVSSAFEYITNLYPLHFSFQTARVCEEKPPLEYNLMDVIWPRKDTKLGSKITYSCPFRTGTTTKQLKGTYRLTLEQSLKIIYFQNNTCNVSGIRTLMKWFGGHQQLKTAQVSIIRRCYQHLPNYFSP